MKATKSKISSVYQGSIIMSVDGHKYVTKQTTNVPKLIKEIEAKHHKKPLITVIPKEGTFILSFISKQHLQNSII